MSKKIATKVRTNFLCVFEKKKQTKQETKQNKNKVKKIGCERLPLQKSTFSPAMAPEKVLLRPLSQDSLGGTPRGRCEEYNSKFSLTTKPRFNRTRRRKKSLLRMMPLTLAGCTTGVSNNMEPAHNTTKILCPNGTVRLSISPVLLKTKD